MVDDARHGSPTAFGDLLRRHRQAAGLTQEELAERARLSGRAVADLERGARLAPRRETVQMLADGLALTPPERAAFVAAARRRPPAAVPDMAEDGGEEEARPDAGAAPARRGGFLGARPAGTLVGREAEMRRVSAALDEAANGHARLIMLAGEPGVGKTRLAQEAMLQAEARGFRVLVGRCYEQHLSLPFYPFVEALTAALALAPAALRQEAPRRFPYLARLLPDLQTASPLQEGDEARLRVLHAVDGFLGALAAETPLALLLDDLHWADSASLDLLLHLARQTADRRVLLLGTYRDVEVNRQHPLERALADLVRERLVEEIGLRGLRRAGTAALIGAHFGVRDVSDELTALVHDRTEGNPFFTEEVLKALVEQGAIFRSGEDWDRKGMQEIEVPRSVRSVVGQRVGRLSAGAQESLRVASILGQEWELELLVGATGQDEDAVLEHLDAALAAHLLEERRTGRRERYAFAHALIGQALYDEVPRHRLRRLHLRAGETLERARGERAEAWAELARHYLAGGDEEQAVRYSLLAGDHAAGLYAHAEAVRHYEAALELLEEAGDTAGAARAREKLGVELRIMGRYEAALAALDRAAETWRVAGDLEGMRRVMASIGWVYAVSGATGEGVQRLREVLPMLEKQGPSGSLAAVYDSLAYVLFVGGRYTEYLTTIEHTASLARLLGDDRRVASAEMQRGNALQMLGYVEDALRVTEGAIALSQEPVHLLVLAGGLNNKGYIHIFRGEFEIARQCNQQAFEHVEQIGDPLWIVFTRSTRSILPFVLGEWTQARTEIEHTVTMSRGLGESWAAAYALLMLGRVCLVEGQWEAATRSLEEAVGHATRIGDLQALRWASDSLAELAVLQGNPDEALARLLPLLDRPDLEEFDVTLFLPVLAWAYLETGETARAEETAAAAIRRARAGQLRVVLVEALRVRALIAIRLGRLADAEAALEEGLALARAMPYPYAEAHLLQVYGRLDAMRGEAAAARQRLHAAHAIYMHLGARKDADLTQQEIAALLGQPGA